MIVPSHADAPYAMDADDAIEHFLSQHGAALHWILRDAAGLWLREDLRSEACWSVLEL